MNIPLRKWQLFILILEMCGIVTNAADEKPNIVFVLADDLGWNDVSFHGMNEIRTPNIDTLAKAGVILNNYYVQSTCTPSRASLLTGRYPIYTGSQHYPFFSGQSQGLSLNFTLLPQYLQQLGYKTHMVGKWHLGYFKKEYTPTYRGFDSHYGFLGGAVGFYQHTNLFSRKPSSFINLPSNIGNDTITFIGYDFYENLNPVQNDNQQHITQLLNKRAVNIIYNHNQEKPLFLYVAHLAVHAPPAFTYTKTPSQYYKRFPYIKDKLRRNFAGELTQLDESIGDIMEALQNSNLLKNTIFIFSSDNGADHSIFPNGGSNYPLRGGKNSVFEGGIRAVGFIWSSLISNSPRISNDIFHVTDWLPTLVNAAGGKERNISMIDGYNQWNMISKGERGPRNEFLINIDPISNISAYRSGNYKLVLGRSDNYKADQWFGPNGIDTSRSLDSVVYDNKVVRVFRQYYGRNNIPEVNYVPISCDKTPPVTDKNQCQFSPCLFNIAEDPCEYNDISGSNLQITQDILNKIESYKVNNAEPYSRKVDYRSDPLKHCGLWTNFLDDDNKNLNCCDTKIK